MPRAVSWFLVAAIALVASYFGLRGLLGNEPQGEPQSRRFEFTAVPPGPGQEAPTFDAHQGDSITLLIRSAQAGEVHIHGYEKTIPLQPGRDSELTFTVTNPGLYALHLHDPDGRMHGLATLAVR